MPFELEYLENAIFKFKNFAPFPMIYDTTLFTNEIVVGVALEHRRLEYNKFFSFEMVPGSKQKSTCPGDFLKNIFSSSYWGRIVLVDHPVYIII